MDQSTYKCVKTIKNVECNSKNGISKLDDNTLVIGSDFALYFVDIETYQIVRFENHSLGYVECLCEIGNKLMLIGNKEGKILCYDYNSNHFRKKIP